MHLPSCTPELVKYKCWLHTGLRDTLPHLLGVLPRHLGSPAHAPLQFLSLAGCLTGSQSRCSQGSAVHSPGQREVLPASPAVLVSCLAATQNYLYLVQQLKRGRVQYDSQFEGTDRPSRQEGQMAGRTDGRSVRQPPHRVHSQEAER